MSNKKTRKEKIKLEKRRQYQLKELQELKEKVAKLEQELENWKLERFKQLNIRNFKLFAHTCNFLAPFALTASLTIGVFRFFGAGFPVYSDEIKKYKVYNLDYKTDCYVSMDNEYRTNRWFDDDLPNNYLVVYTPWEEQAGQYVRYKRNYNLDNFPLLDLFDAVLNENYSYILTNLTEYSEEKQVINEINLEKGNNYFFEASLHFLDDEDILKYNETDLKNIIITIIESVLTLGIGGVIAYRRDFRFLDEVNITNNEYKYKISLTNQKRQELATANEKIQTLTRTMGGKTNE